MSRKAYRIQVTMAHATAEKLKVAAGTLPLSAFIRDAADKEAERRLGVAPGEQAVAREYGRAA